MKSASLISKNFVTDLTFNLVSEQFFRASTGPHICHFFNLWYLWQIWGLSTSHSSPVLSRPSQRRNSHLELGPSTRSKQNKCLTNLEKEKPIRRIPVLLPDIPTQREWQLVGYYHKVNRCLARYSPRATTTNRPTNRAPNKLAWHGPNWPKMQILGQIWSFLGKKSFFLLEKSKVLLPT